MLVISSATEYNDRSAEKKDFFAAPPKKKKKKLREQQQQRGECYWKDSHALHRRPKRFARKLVSRVSRIAERQLEFEIIQSERGERESMAWEMKKIWRIGIALKYWLPVVSRLNGFQDSLRGERTFANIKMANSSWRSWNVEVWKFAWTSIILRGFSGQRFFWIWSRRFGD